MARGATSPPGHQQQLTRHHHPGDVPNSCPPLCLLRALRTPTARAARRRGAPPAKTHAARAKCSAATKWAHDGLHVASRGDCHGGFAQFNARRRRPPFSWRRRRTERSRAARMAGTRTARKQTAGLTVHQTCSPGASARRRRHRFLHGVCVTRPADAGAVRAAAAILLCATSLVDPDWHTLRPPRARRGAPARPARSPRTAGRDAIATC